MDNKTSADLTGENMEGLNKRLRDIYAKLPKGPLSTETLADVLRSFRPELDEQSALDDCAALKDGIRDGTEMFAATAEKPDNMLGEEIPNRLEQVLRDMSSEKRRQVLLLLYQSLCAQNGMPLDGRMAVYVSEMPDEQLERHVGFLLRNRSELEAARIAETFTNMPLSAYEPPEQMKRYTDEQNCLIMGTALNSLAPVNGVMPATAYEIGTELGLMTTFFNYFKKALPKITGVLSASAVCFSAVYLGQLATVQQAFMLISRAFSGILNPGILSAMTLTAAGLGVGWVYETTEDGMQRLLQQLNEIRKEKQTMLNGHIAAVSACAQEKYCSYDADGQENDETSFEESLDAELVAEPWEEVDADDVSEKNTYNKNT